MAGSLPALFSRIFLIGYIIPAAAILLATCAVIDLHIGTTMFAAAKSAITSSPEKLLAIGIGIFAALAWVLAVLLMVSNLALIQLLEGYGSLNPAQLLKWRTLRIFTKLSEERDQMADKLRAGTLSQAQQDQYGDALARLADEFPEQKDLVLPTRFGNVVRAFERYPQVVYGIDAINAWARLQAVIGEAYCLLLDEAKAQLDLLVNLWFGALMICALHLSLLAWALIEGNGVPRHLGWGAWAIPIAALAAALLAAKWAQSAAAQWGALVKGAFDLYRGELCRQMGLEMPRSIEHERAMWTTVAQTMLYRLPEYADGLTQYRPLNPLGQKDEKVPRAE